MLVLTYRTEYVYICICICTMVSYIFIEFWGPLFYFHPFSFLRTVNLVIFFFVPLVVVVVGFWFVLRNISLINPHFLLSFHVKLFECGESYERKREKKIPNNKKTTKRIKQSTTHKARKQKNSHTCICIHISTVDMLEKG